MIRRLAVAVRRGLISARRQAIAAAAGLCALGAAGLLAAPAVAGAAEGRLYWSAYGVVETPAAIRYGSLTGGPFSTLFSEGPVLVSEKHEPVETEGVVLDPASGKLYWADEKTGAIMQASLSGQGTPSVLYQEPTTPTAARPDGLAIDPQTGSLYWTNEGSGEIREGEVSGTAARTLYSKEFEPVGITLDAATGTLYWADYTAGEIRAGASGGGEAKTLYTEEISGKPDGLVGVAVDEGNGDLYWSNYTTRQIVAGSVLGEGAAKSSVLYTEPEKAGVFGLALEPASGTLYWADFESGQLRTGRVGGEKEVAASTLFAESPTDEPDFLDLLLAPSATAAPTLSGSAQVGHALSCSQGSWAADQPGSSLYRSPTSFTYAWLRDGSAIAGADSSSFTPSEGGSYTCQVSATNAAGSSASASAAVNVPAPAPSVTISAPASGGTYTEGQLVATSFSCLEGAGGPGLSSCDDSNGTSTGAGGAGHLSTSIPGAHTYTVTALSKDGQSASASISYTVVAPPVPVIRIASGKASVVRGRAKVSLACVGKASCSGRLLLELRVKVVARRRGRRRKVHFETVVLGRASYSLAAGAHRLLVVKLTKRALKLLTSAKHHRLRVIAQGSVKGGRSVKRSLMLVLGSGKVKGHLRKG